MKRYFDLYFTTATIHNWIPLLEQDVYKEILIESFKFCVKEQRATIWAFVIMSNHFHIVWQILEPHSLGKVRQNLLKYTAQQFKFHLLDAKDEKMLQKFYVDKIDRQYQFWKRNPLSVEIYSDKVLEQKINYIHHNPEAKKINGFQYKYTSARYYETGKKDWDFLL